MIVLEENIYQVGESEKKFVYLIEFKSICIFQKREFSMMRIRKFLLQIK